MRPTPWLLAEPHRLRDELFAGQYGNSFGVFIIPHPPTAAKLRVIVDDGKAEGFNKDYAWEHVSVSLPNRCPNWPEMAFIKSVFWAEHETVMQLHVPTEHHRNLHPYCLHLWRPINQSIPTPPNEMVAVPGDLKANFDYLTRNRK